MEKSTERGKVSKQPASQDIVQIIEEDHVRIKELIEVMKDTDKSRSDREEAFEEFVPLLISHSKPEEEILYSKMKKNEELREEGFEGDVEHALADQLVEEIFRTEVEDLWSARVKVLAELVEHHIEEEESETLPSFKKHSEESERIKMGQQFLIEKTRFLEQGGMDAIPEKFLSRRSRKH